MAKKGGVGKVQGEERVGGEEKEIREGKKRYRLTTSPVNFSMMKNSSVSLSPVGVSSGRD